MSQFSYEQYAAAQERAANSANSVKIGWFKLSPNQEAVVRFNISALSDLQFASVHTVKTTDGRWMKVSCLNEVGSYSDSCPLCTAAGEGNADIQKVSKKVYVQLLASYKDPATGTFSAPVPVIWERAAGFSKEIATLLRDYGNLRDILLKVTRNGSGLDTRYAISYAVPTVYKPELIPADFGAFENFKIEKHSYWEKSAEEIEHFLMNGTFPEVAKAEPAVSKNLEQVIPNKAAEAQIEKDLGFTAPAPAPVVEPKVEPQPAPAAPATPKRFSF